MSIASTAGSLRGGTAQPLRPTARRVGLFVLLFICGMAIYFFGVPYFDIFPTNRNLGYSAAGTAILLVAALWLRRNARLAEYWESAFALFIGSAAILVTLLAGGFGKQLLDWLNLTISTSQGKAIGKLYEVSLFVVPMIVLTKVAGGDLGSIFIKRGNLTWGLGIGALVLFNFTASAFLFFASRFTDPGKLGAAVVWGTLFAFANGFMEELWLRGILLRPFQKLLGTGGAVLLTALVFSLMHAGVVYLTPPAIPFMVANTLSMGIACGYLMMKTDSIWGATLIHAAADLFLFIAMLAEA